MAESNHIGCIDDLLGPQARALGCRCPCPAHTPPGSEDVAPSRRADVRTPRDHKMVAAGDDSDLPEDSAEADRLYRERRVKNREKDQK